MAFGFSISFTQFWSEVSPSHRRGTLFNNWGKALMYPLDWLNNNVFVKYANGASYAVYNSASTYTTGQKVNGSDRAIYEAIQNVPINTPPQTNPLYWYKIAPYFIGLNERIGYNSQIITLTYALNRFFQTTFVQPPGQSDIYISPGNSIYSFLVSTDQIHCSSISSNVNNTNAFTSSTSPNYSIVDFTVNVPLSVYNALGSTDAIRQAIIRSIVNNYVLSGMIYNVITY